MLAEPVAGLSGTPPGHTFIVPAYKESPFLGACLASLRAQSVASRILITTSTPCTYISRIADAFDVPVAVNPQRRSIGADWNFGLDHATTRLVTWAHQDDMYAPQFLAAALDRFTRFPGITLTFTNYQEISDAGQPRTSKISLVKDALLAVFAGHRELIGARRGRLLLSFGDPITCSSVTVDRTKLGEFRFSESLATNLDWDAWVTLIERGDTFAYCRDRLVQRRYNDLTETSQALRDGRRRAEDQMMFDRLWPRAIAGVLQRLYAAGY